MLIKLYAWIILAIFQIWQWQPSPCAMFILPRRVVLTFA